VPVSGLVRRYRLRAHNIANEPAALHGGLECVRARPMRRLRSRDQQLPACVLVARVPTPGETAFPRGSTPFSPAHHPGPRPGQSTRAGACLERSPRSCAAGRALPRLPRRPRCDNRRGVTLSRGLFESPRKPPVARHGQENSSNDSQRRSASSLKSSPRNRARASPAPTACYAAWVDPGLPKGWLFLFDIGRPALPRNWCAWPLPLADATRRRRIRRYDAWISMPNASSLWRSPTAA